MTPLPDACTQLSLDLFPAPSFESILDFRGLRGLNVIKSSRLRRGWYMKTDMRTGQGRLVVPAHLENAPQDVKTALVDWALLLHKSRGRRDRKAAAMKKELERRVYRHIESCGMARPGPSRFDPRTIETRGCRYDLAEVFDTLNRVYFNAGLSSYVRWGNSLYRSYQSNKYDRQGCRYSLITIGAMYDRPDVPRHAVEGIMFHEMLHIAIPPVTVRGRTIIHGGDFKRRERLFPHYAQWLAWETSVLNRILKKD